MLDFDQIISQYPEPLQQFKRSIFREYLQYKILQAIFDSKHATKLSFLGGTALRIVHGNTRFSEDIDLDNFGLSWQEFEEVIDKVKHLLILEGFDVEIRNIKKGAYHCYLRFPKILFDQGLSSLPAEKILIQIDTVAQGFSYLSENYFLNKFDVFTDIRVTPIDILLSQKIFAAVNRKRPKGRDFYDITFLVSRTKPNYDYLYLKMGIENKVQLKNQVLDYIEKFDFKLISKDVTPFLLNQNDIKRVTKFKEFWLQNNFC